MEKLKNFIGIVFIFVIVLSACFCESIADVVVCNMEKKENAIPIILQKNEKKEKNIPAPSIGCGRDVLEKENKDFGLYEKITKEELDLLAEIVYLEAGGESLECQKAVCGVIINRLKNGAWGETIFDVIYAKTNGFFEFESIYYLGKQKVPETTKKIVIECIKNGALIDSDIMFFRSDYYHKWNGAIDEFNIDNTYFSSSVWLK